MTAHAKFSPSSAHRWIACPGSIVLEGRLPQQRTTSKYADEGTAAHHIAALILGGESPANFLNLWWRVELDGKTYIHHVEPASQHTPGNRGRVDEDFIGAVLVYVNYVRDLSVGCDVFVEQRVNISDVLGVPNQFGTSDYIAVDEAKRHMHVADLKFGTGEQVYAQENYQGMLYALGALHEMEVLYGKDFCDFVTVHIAQPRLDHLDPWMVDVNALRAFGRLAAEAVALASGPGGETKLNPSDKTCRWCKVQATCPALSAKVSELFVNDPEAIDLGRAPAMAPASPSVATNELLSRKNACVDLLESFAKAVRAEVERRVVAGQEILGTDGLPLKIVEGRRGNRTWVGTQLPVIEGLLLGAVGDKAYEPRSLITAGAAAKMLDKKATKMQWEPFKALITQNEGRATVALGSDPRPPRQATAATAEFTEVEDPLCE